MRKTDYDTVVWILGNESTVNDTFNATEQTKVSQFIAAGGNLFVSGSEIAWDLDSQNNGRSFFEDTLKGNFVSDDANTNTAVQVGGGIFAGLSSFVFSSGSPSTGANAYSTRDAQLYNVTSPDVIAAQPGAVVALNYNNGSGAAAIQVEGEGAAGNIVMFGFPFETMSDATRRQQAIGRIFDFFSLSAPAPAIDIEVLVNGDDADLPVVQTLAAGSTATFTYNVVNTGNIPLSGVIVSDDNGTPQDVSDDFSPTFAGGDADGDGLLDEEETWTYSAQRVIVAGLRSSIGSVVAQGNLQSVTDSDGVNYFGEAAAIDVKARVNGEDAVSPTGPIFAVGSVASFTYEVANTGNVSLSNVVLTDDAGTPGNAADDINPTFDGGDANGNNVLEVGETWTYSISLIVTAGQYSSVGSVAAQGFLQSAADSDAANYFGAAPMITIEAKINGQDADSPTGPILAAGSTAAFTYEVANAGNIALGGVVVIDDNGTPGSAADDFTPTFDGGDADADGLLDVSEIWTFSASRTVVAGQYSSNATVAADGVVQAVTDSDAANYFGAAPAITIQARVNGANADSPPGAVRNVGDIATLIYIVRNAGNMALSNLVVVDDNGTPGNAADDVSPTYITGDVDGNAQLDLTEIWLYLAFQVVTVGQHANLATAQGVDVINQIASDDDPAYYLGVGQATADFNASGQVDGGDFLAWQRGYGMTGNAALADGDGTGDQTVDDVDLAVWAGGLNASLAAATASAAAKADNQPIPSFLLAASNGVIRTGAGANTPSNQRRLGPSIDPRELWRPSPRPEFSFDQAAMPLRRQAHEQPLVTPSSSDWAECVDRALDLLSEVVATL